MWHVDQAIGRMLSALEIAFLVLRGIRRDSLATCGRMKSCKLCTCRSGMAVHWSRLHLSAVNEWLADGSHETSFVERPAMSDWRCRSKGLYFSECLSLGLSIRLAVIDDSYVYHDSCSQTWNSLLCLSLCRTVPSDKSAKSDLTTHANVHLPFQCLEEAITLALSTLHT